MVSLKDVSKPAVITYDESKRVITITKLFLDNWVDPMAENGMLLLTALKLGHGSIACRQAARNGSPKQIKRLLKSPGIDLALVSPYASLRNNTYIVSLFLSHMKKDQVGKTPSLKLASSRGYFDVVKQLLAFTNNNESLTSHVNPKQ